jgi:hypothetical protein
VNPRRPRVLAISIVFFVVLFIALVSVAGFGVIAARV